MCFAVWSIFSRFRISCSRLLAMELNPHFEQSKEHLLGALYDVTSNLLTLSHLRYKYLDAHVYYMSKFSLKLLKLWTFSEPIYLQQITSTGFGVRNLFLEINTPFLSYLYLYVIVLFMVYNKDYYYSSHMFIKSSSKFNRLS